MNQSAKLEKRKKLELSLRRDRGYIYFPDAIQRCIEASVSDSWSWVRGECYKTSSKEIYAERCAGGIFSRKETNLFGSLVIVGPKVQETWLMKEGLGSIQAHYDLEQPIFDVKITGQYLEMNSSSAVFPSDFHRYAYLCKMLFHHLLGNADRRMLLQRIHIEQFTLQPGLSAEDSVGIELLTKDYSILFSLLRNGVRIGSLAAAAREPLVL